MARVGNPALVAVRDERDGEDRLSMLPNDLLLHIFTFLDDTKDVVRTSVLSRRWLDLWLYASNVNIPNLPNRNVETIRNGLNRLLANPFGPQLQQFRLGCLYLKPEVYLSWVPFVAFARNLVHLHLHDLDIPEDIVHRLCASPHLTSLKLEHAYFKTQLNHFQDSLKFSTPTLTHLSLLHCDYYYHRNLTINTPNLLHLSLDFFNCDLTISAPALEVFSMLNAPILGNFYFQEFPALQNAVIHFGDLKALIRALARLHYIELNSAIHSSITGIEDPDAEQDPLDLLGTAIHTVLHAIRHATSLQFSSVVFQHFPQVPHVLNSLPSLTDLYNLKLTDWSSQRFNCFLPVLFAHCPNLQTLFIQNTRLSLGGEMVHAEQQQSFECPMPCLRNMRIENLQTSLRECDFVRFLFVNANHLQNAVLTTDSALNRAMLYQFLTTLGLPEHMMITVSIQGS